MTTNGITAWSPENVQYWEAAARGELLVKWCGACQQYHYYPREICPHCGSSDTRWRVGSGKGVIYSFSVMRRANPPYAIAYVTLDEGVTMLTNIVDCDLDSLGIGQVVQVKFRRIDDGREAPMFTPVDERGLSRSESHSLT
jgi:uncharacterized OB-fold protein